MDELKRVRRLSQKENFIAAKLLEQCIEVMQEEPERLCRYIDGMDDQKVLAALVAHPEVKPGLPISLNSISTKRRELFGNFWFPPKANKPKSELEQLKERVEILDAKLARIEVAIADLLT